MLTGKTRDARMTTSVKNMTTVWMACAGIAALLVTLVCADGPTSLAPSTAASVPLNPASGNTTQAATGSGDASHVVSSLVVVAFGAIFGWFV